MSLRDLVTRLADRDSKRSEATIQADIRAFLLEAPLYLSENDLVEDVHLESPAGDRKRIDVETGTTVIEVKRDLRRAGVLADALNQLAGYVEAREAVTKRRYAGVLTDGAEWRCYQLSPAGLEEASAITVRKEKPDLDALLVWLEGVLATAQDIPPDPEEIKARLGAGSSSHSLDRASLRNLYAQHKGDPAVRMKRQLWARLLTTALGSQFNDSDDLFVEHTLLVNIAEIIAHAVLGLDVRLLPPASLLSGAKFTEHGIYGVVEPDFFDWPVHIVPGGDVFIRTLARRLSRFDWRSVKHDVLKILYESVITNETRKKLGEYYTPDWLAERLVEVAVRDPLAERVLDPACGSGTFLFHAVRRYLAAAEASGLPISKALAGVAAHVTGMDLHPVAVTLARVTYVLAIGPQRITDREREDIQIPVYLGDSMQWQQKQVELWTAGYLVIQADTEANLFALELRFPDSLLGDTRKFDRLVDELAKRAANRRPGSAIPSLGALFRLLGISEEVQPAIEETFRAMCRLHDDGRNHIWGYYVRNLARPVWLARTENRVDVLIGNPPWLAYRHMTREMQAKFREMCQSRHLWQGAAVATQQDLSGLFVARAIQLYLRRGGQFAFVMPNAALDRAQFAGFRTGEYPDPSDVVRLSFDTPWDLRRLRPHLFPRGSAVVFGERVSDQVRRMPQVAEIWEGTLEPGDSWLTASKRLTHRVEALRIVDPDSVSSYKERFRNGASIFPRVLFAVEEKPPGPLGLAAGKTMVRSLRSANEKKPWKNVESLEGVVESEFVHHVLFAEHVMPYRALPPARAVVPLYLETVLDSGNPHLDLFPDLARWWRQAEQIWQTHRSSDRLSLRERLDYHGELTAQFPIQSNRVVYTKSGMHIAAVRVENRRLVIDHTLYWSTASSQEEARYLVAVLNSAEITRQVRPLMSYGKDERHTDKHIWSLPIPEFDSGKTLHAELAVLAGELEAEVQRLTLSHGRNFVALRRQVRSFLGQNLKAQRLEQLVARLLA